METRFTQSGRRFAAKSVSRPFERCQQQNLMPGRCFPYRVTSTVRLPAICFGSCTLHSKPAVLSILCRGVELHIPSDEKCRRCSTWRIEAPPWCNTFKEEEPSSGETSYPFPYGKTLLAPRNHY